jgi:DNA-binding NtrC family response regulator
VESPEKAEKHHAALRFIESIRKRRISFKLLVVLIPAMVALLAVTGYVTYNFSNNFLDKALQRSVQFQTLGLARELGSFLENARDDLLLIAEDAPAPDDLETRLSHLNRVRPGRYLELAYVPFDGESQTAYCILANGVARRIQNRDSKGPLPDPMASARAAAKLPPLTVRIEPVTLVEVRPQPEDALLREEAVRLIAALHQDGAVKGAYLLSVKAKRLRDILSLYNSEDSPIWAVPRSPEVRFSYIFDTNGWMLFQSEDYHKPLHEMTTYLARAGYTGTLGKPGQPMAFRPESRFTEYWRMHAETLQARHGVIEQPETTAHAPGFGKSYFLGYAPVMFSPAPGAAPTIYAGLANIDKSSLNLRAGYKHIDVMFIATLATILLLSLVTYFLGRTITRPIIRLAAAVHDIRASGELKEIVLPDYDAETSSLKVALNEMIRTVRRQMAEIRERDATIKGVQARQPAPLDAAATDLSEDEPKELLGVGPLMETLRADVRKAAQVEADVLIVGETGTGKQLVAEAVHRLSLRSQNPFIAINCGALDENLLLDSLFGHVKGAFTEARGDRKGAFQEAQGGVLFLDEIQSATAKVQQALLRAIAMRKIRPLGSDRELDVNVRLLAASNVDLRAMIREGQFREDLYYRLKVVTIHTPPLRTLKESIPILAMGFLHMAEAQTGRAKLALSKGALEKLLHHDWPGNVRELKHAMLRAAIMSEGFLIQKEDIRLDEESVELLQETIFTWPKESLQPEPENGVVSEPDYLPAEIGSESVSASSRPQEKIAPKELDGLNPRQKIALKALSKSESLTRADYQAMQQETISPRTALNDLSDLVERGLLVKLGAGPSTRYQFNLQAVSEKDASQK